jgi:hypothetical protein
VDTDGSPARLSSKLVSADYFKVFGMKQPHIGRTFAAGEDQPGAAPAVVISWARRKYAVELGGNVPLWVST